MLARTWSAALVGIEARLLEVEVDISNGLPNFQIVGLPDTAIRESRERIRAALRNIGCDLPPKLIVVNLAPADMRKEGSALDLPIAVGLLAAMGRIPLHRLEDRVLVGELSLDGSLRPITGGLPIALAAAREGRTEVIVPLANGPECAVVRDVTTIAIDHLPAVVEHLRGDSDVSPATPAPREAGEDDGPDLADVRGQAAAKRALEIAACGDHNILMIGPPGAGKTMLAERLPGILPPLDFDSAIETTAIHSVAGTLPAGVGLIGRRPFRAPHHSASGAGLVGGGNPPGPGEISLAHNGVLFLDELPEFRRDILELLRQPLESGSITLVRSSRRVTWPSRFTLVCAMNPCPCGFLGHPKRSCRCTPLQIDRYSSRISGPLLDRIDLQLEVPPVAWKELSTDTTEEPSSAVRERVLAARDRQLERNHGRPNSTLESDDLRRWAAPDEAGERLLESAMDRLGLSARASTRILRVARTIADLGDASSVSSAHVAEAIRYRRLDQARTGT